MSGIARIAMVAVVAAILGGGGLVAYRYVAALPPVVSVTGRVDAPSVVILAPASGMVSILSVAEGQDVKQGDLLAWMTDSLDNSPVSITAPHTGRITSLALHQGQFALIGTPVVVVHELTSLHALLDVDEKDVGRVAVGQAVDLSFTSLGLTASASVGEVASIPIANSAARAGQSRKYEVKVPLSATDQRIRVGLPVDARIHVTSKRP